MTVRASDAAYQSIQLGDGWFVTPDPVAHPSSLNRTQSAVDADGFVRYVVSERDPGVANWLGTGGTREGYLMLRWQGIETPLTAEDPPEAERVPLAALADALPPGTRRVSAEERSQALAARRAIPTLKN